MPILRSAHFSPCRTYRYTLERYWDDKRPRVLFVLLNPSTADAYVDDPTNRRGINFAMRWGAGSCIFVNLFAFRTPSPKIMKQAEEPIGPENDWWIDQQAEVADAIVLAWGNHGTYLDRGKAVRSRLAAKYGLNHMGLTKQGEPKHILYLPNSTELQSF